MSEQFVGEVPPPQRNTPFKYEPILLELVARSKKTSAKEDKYQADFDTSGKAIARRRALLRAAHKLAEDPDHPEIDEDSFTVVTRYQTRKNKPVYSVFAEYHPKNRSSK